MRNNKNRIYEKEYVRGEGVRYHLNQYIVRLMENYRQQLVVEPESEVLEIQPMDVDRK